MLDTNLTFCEADLKETIVMMLGDEDIKIRHRFTQNENRFVNTVTIDGNTYAYGNLVQNTDDETEQKRLIKRYAKLALYKAISKIKNITLPWGALTGIRPTKLAYTELQNGRDFKEFFADVMKVGEQKITLTERVIESQKGIYEYKDGNTDFFVFIPFCPSRCRYCSFITADYKSTANLVDEYIDALIKEIRASKDCIKKLRSIYIGGGTPAVLDKKNLEKLLIAIDEINTGVEYTFEAGRPDVITTEKIDLLLKHKVTRVCINPQTFNQKTLDIIGRNHTAEEIEQKYEMVKGKFIVNMDLIAGLPEESFEDFKYSLEKTIALNPENITVHTLCVKHGSFFAENGKATSAEDIEKMMEFSHEVLWNSGYKPYYLYRQKYMAGNLENAGYCKGDTQCIYNIDVMEETADNVACGAGAVSKRVNYEKGDIERYGAPKDVKTYLTKVDTIIREKAELFKK